MWDLKKKGKKETSPCHQACVYLTVIIFLHWGKSKAALSSSCSNVVLMHRNSPSGMGLQYVSMRVFLHVWWHVLTTIWAHTSSCQDSVQLIFMHSVTSSLQTLLNILFPWAFHCCLVSEINMYEARRWEFLIDLCGPALLFNICLGLLVPAQWRWNNQDNLLRHLS